MDSAEENVTAGLSNQHDKDLNEPDDEEKLKNQIGIENVTEPSLCGDTSACADPNLSKDGDGSVSVNSKKTKKKSRHGKKSHALSKETSDRNVVRRVHHVGAKFKQAQGRKRAQSFPTMSKFFLPNKRPRKDVFIPPTKFLLGGNISDPLNLNSLQDEDVNRAMNAVTPESSPLPTPPRHKAKIDVIIPPNIRDPLNLMEPLDNDEYEKRLEMQQRKPRKKARLRRRTTDNTSPSQEEKTVEKTEGIKEPLPPEPSSSATKSRKRSCSDSDNASQKAKDCSKKLRRMDSLDKIVSPVVPQPGAWMRARQPRAGPSERPASPHRTKSLSEGDSKLPTFHAKNSKYQYGNYDR